MIIVLKADVEADHPEVRRLIELAESFPDVHTELHRIQGATRSLTEIYLLGRTGVIPTTPFEEFACVEKVVRITERFRAIGRHGGGLEAVGFEYNGVRISQDTFHLFPGLCAVDTRQNVETMFAALQRFGIVTTRAGAYKPRTSPYDFQGLGREGLEILASMRLCANVPGQYAIQTALGGYQSINDLVLPTGRLARQRDLAWELVTAIPGVSCVKPKATLYMFPKLDPAIYPIEDDQAFIAELLEAERVLLVQGSGFNWPQPDHFRLVFLPHEDNLRDAIGRIARFLEGYRKRHGR